MDYTHVELEQFLPRTHHCGGCKKEMVIKGWKDEFYLGQAVKVANSFCNCGKQTTTIIGGEWQ